MDSDITTGNAIIDGKDFRYWFVGPIEKWCKDNNIQFDAEEFGLRNTEGLEIKWGIYKKDEERSVWAPCSNKTAMSILIKGDLIFRFRDSQNQSKCREVRLNNEGDYVIWSEDVQHTWKMNQDSVILTLRWLC